MDSQFYINLIAGSNKIQRICEWTTNTALRLRLSAIAPLNLRENPLQPWIGQSKFGTENPFFGRNHSQVTKYSMSAKKGSLTFVYSINKNKVLMQRKTNCFPNYKWGYIYRKVLIHWFLVIILRVVLLLQISKINYKEEKFIID